MSFGDVGLAKTFSEGLSTLGLALGFVVLVGVVFPLDWMVGRPPSTPFPAIGLLAVEPSQLPPKLYIRGRVSVVPIG